MSFITQKIMEKEKNERKKLEGYRKHLFKVDLFAESCPYCSEALSIYDVQKEQCVNCGHPFYSIESDNN